VTAVETAMPDRAPTETREKRVPTRTCVGCGARAAAAHMVHLFAFEGVVVVDALFSAGGGLRHEGQHGRGAHVHPRAACIAKAPAGLSRSLRGPSGVTGADVAQALVVACDRRLQGLIVSARRRGELAVGADAALDAARRGAPVILVALDAGSVAGKVEVVEAIGAGRCIAWGTKATLGALLGGPVHGVAICAVTNPGIASELKKVRAAADAGVTATGEDARCRCPEAR
jgi:predicted RNA-binding protein YlxR (DUF448 family)